MKSWVMTYTDAEVAEAYEQMCFNAVMDKIARKYIVPNMLHEITYESPFLEWCKRESSE